MTARRIIASVSKGRMDDAMRECAVCACGTTALHGEPERVVGDVTHGVLVCMDGLPAPECCRDCGEPFNDADAPASGLCAACGADYYDDAEDLGIAEREALKDWEDSRGGQP